MYLFANEIIIPERLNLSWSQNFTCLQTGEICSSMVTKNKKKLRFCSQVSPPDSGEGYSEELFRLSFTLSCLLDNLSRCDLI